jgi:hypothetical protein
MDDLVALTWENRSISTRVRSSRFAIRTIDRWPHAFSS